MYGISNASAAAKNAPIDVPATCRKEDRRFSVSKKRTHPKYDIPLRPPPLITICVMRGYDMVLLWILLHRGTIHFYNMNARISLNELYQLKRKKEYTRVQHFDKVLDRCYSRIRKVAEQGGLNTFYEVPGMIVGLPLYNIQTCTEYIIKKLRDSGFLVQLMPPPSMYVVYVCWDPEEIKPMKQSAPTLLPPSSAPSSTPVNKLRLF
jgi:hypothetical protein